jgi:hypothetical protein
MTQKPLLCLEVVEHAVCKRPERGGLEWAGAGVAWRLYVPVLSLKHPWLPGSAAASLHHTPLLGRIHPRYKKNATKK